MPHVSFVKNYPALEVEPGANLMDALLKAGRPVASSCFGDGVCGRCRVQVVKGAANLSAFTPAEELVRDRLRIPSDIRLSCQSQVLGDVTIDTTYW